MIKSKLPFIIMSIPLLLPIACVFLENEIYRRKEDK